MYIRIDMHDWGYNYTVEPQSYVPLGKKGVRNSEMYVTQNNDVTVVFHTFQHVL